MDLSHFWRTQDRVYLFSIFIGLFSSEGVIESGDVGRFERSRFGLNRLDRWLILGTTVRYVSADINLD